MKTATNVISFFTAFSILVTAFLKISHLPGAGEALCFTGLLLGVYFPAYILDRFGEVAVGRRCLPLYIVAAICASLTEFGITFRLWYWPGAGALLTLGLAGFSLLFIPILLWKKFGADSRGRVMNCAGAGGLAAFGLGILFKLQHWPGATVLLALCPIFLMLVYFPVYIMSFDEDEVVKHAHLRNSFFVIVTGTLLALYFVKSIEIHDAIR